MNPHSVHLENASVFQRGRPILVDVSWRVAAGSCCAVLGPNGSGKSTLLAVLSGYLWPSRGTVRIGGQEYGKVDLARIRRTIGLIEPSRSPAFDERMSVREVIATGLFGTIRLPFHEDVSPQAWEHVDVEIEQFGLARFQDTAFCQLSTGEQMKTLLARAIVAEAGLLLLDEPTAGLDMGARAACMGVLDRLRNRADPPTVVMISHHLDELPRSVDQVVLLKGGSIAADGPAGTVLTTENLSRLFDCRVQVLRNDGRYVASVQER